jgi:hypothetical protein
VHGLLHDRHVDVVPLVGVYSNSAYPFSLVYRHMDNLDVMNYLKNEPNAGRVKLVIAPYTLSFLKTSPLMFYNDS